MTVFGMKFLLALATAVLAEAIRNRVPEDEFESPTVVENVKYPSDCPGNGEYDAPAEECILDGYYSRVNSVFVESQCKGGLYFPSKSRCYLKGEHTLVEGVSRQSDCKLGVYFDSQKQCYLEGHYTLLEGVTESDCSVYFENDRCYDYGYYTRIDGVTSRECKVGIYLSSAERCYLDGRWECRDEVFDESNCNELSIYFSLQNNRQPRVNGHCPSPAQPASPLGFEQTDPSHGDIDEYAAEKAALEAAGSTDDARYALVLTNMAACLGCQGREEEALKLYWDAKAACERASATETPAYADTLLNIGDSLNEQGQHSQAMDMFDQARETYELLGWEKTMNYAIVLHNIGECYLEQGNKDMSVTHLMAARDAYHSVVLGTESPQYAALLEDLRRAGVQEASAPACPKLEGVDLAAALRGAGLEE